MTAMYERVVLNCEDVEPEVFFAWESDKAEASRIEHATEAMRVCFGCPLRVECVLNSLRAETGVLRFGIWGGTTPAERRAMVRRGVSTEREVWNELVVLDQRSMARRVSTSKPPAGHVDDSAEAAFTEGLVAIGQALLS